MRNSLLFCLIALSLHGQTIREKKEGFGGRSKSDLDPKVQASLVEINADRTDRLAALKDLYCQVTLLQKKSAPTVEFKALLDRINQLKEEMAALDIRWKENAVNGTEEYGLWHQPETSLEQIVLEYGSQDYVYLITDDIGAIKLSMQSNIPVPRAAWGEMLELILSQNGIGIRQLNPYLRELYYAEETGHGVRLITNKREDLELATAETRLCFVLSPEPAEVRRAWIFLQKFANPRSTSLNLIGRDLFLIGSALDLAELLKLYDFVAKNRGDKDYKLTVLTHVAAEEMAKILSAVFDPVAETAKQKGEQDEIHGLKAVLLPHTPRAIFLVGTKEEIHQADKIIQEVEGQFGDVGEKVIHWYTVKHSDADEIAVLLDKIYSLMINERIEPIEALVKVEKREKKVPITQEKLYQESFFQSGSVAVNPAPVELVSKKKEKSSETRHNFIVDAKTNSIVMVVEASMMPKIKELAKKLDVPKKMVQIEVLLFEKKIANDQQIGLNFLKMGEGSRNVDSKGLTWNDTSHGHAKKGILSFIYSRMKGDGIPAYDLIYNFLLSQSDIQINASPSITTINQTMAKIAIVEEISLRTGIYDVETAKGNTLKEAYTRAQYGITLEITPTIHLRGLDGCAPDDGLDYITLDTNVVFDTAHKGHDPSQPTVTRRNIKNEVLIPDGQTVILGGLRRKQIHDEKDSIPFLGELPGFGKLFSNTMQTDGTTEMFIFITPKIVSDPVDDISRIRNLELTKRPGDIPEFLCHLQAARDCEKRRLMKGTLSLLFGRPKERCLPNDDPL